MLNCGDPKGGPKILISYVTKTTKRQDGITLAISIRPRIGVIQGKNSARQTMFPRKRALSGTITRRI